MDPQSFALLYRTKSDEELLDLADQRNQLTADAQVALSGELAIRRIKVESGSNPQAPARPARQQTDSPSRTQIGTGEFIEEVLRFYNRNRWSFIKLVFPTILLTSIAYIFRRHEVLDIERHLPRGIALMQHKTELIEIGVLTWGSLLFSWIAFCFSQSAIAILAEQIQAGFPVSSGEPFRIVSNKIASFLRLSLLLFAGLVLSLGVALASLLATLSTIESHSGHIRSFTFSFITYCAFALVILLTSRWALAIPALVLDDYGVWKTLYVSYELTRGTWPILAVLLFKSVIGGYIAGMLPFWLFRFIPVSSHLPSWFGWVLTGVSLLAVTAVEPIMFIGFALLYLKTSAAPVTPKAQDVPA